LNNKATKEQSFAVLVAWFLCCSKYLEEMHRFRSDFRHRQSPCAEPPAPRDIWGETGIFASNQVSALTQNKRTPWEPAD